MSHHLAGSPVSPEPGTRWKALAVPVLAALSLSLGAVVLAADSQPVHTYHLDGRLSGTIDGQGSLKIILSGTDTVLLQGEILPVTTSRRQRLDRARPAFIEISSEGRPGGQRGFSALADDDQDGMIDEDPLDGMDNDGDDRIDEDYAAISDAMVVVHQTGRSGTGRAGHLEYYHWANAHIRSTVFLGATGNPGLTNGGTYRISTPRGKWEEVEVKARWHGISGKARVQATRALVAEVSIEGRSGSGCDPDRSLWFGLVPLDLDQPAYLALGDGWVDVALDENPVPLAVCTAESWLQLSRMLNDAVRVHRGASDPVTEKRAPWVVPPLCPNCRLGSVPEFTWSAEGSSGDLLLTANLKTGHSGTFDPNLFKVGSEWLGAPSLITWRPNQGQIVEAPWICLNQELLGQPYDRLGDPYGEMPLLLGHEAAGRLVFRFPGKASVMAAGSLQMAGRYLDGRHLKTELRKAAPAGVPSPDVTRTDSATETLEGSLARTSGGLEKQAEILDASKRQPSLAPELLNGWPNPFFDSIQIQFRVPQTMGETFFWPEDEEVPSGLDLQMVVPWKSGIPDVSVKIYSLNGQELVTLQSGSLSEGEYTTHWDGTDAFGRQVASGTYFCKLQMDQWSVTRRVVFLR